MSRFYVPKENIRKNKILIAGAEAHHILDVMRMQDKDKVVVFDGTGNEYTGFIENINRPDKKLIVEIVSTRRPVGERQVEVTLAQAIPRKNKMEHIIEKATELGAGSIIPMITDRTIVRPGPASEKTKHSRWKKIALVASKQCGRAYIPMVEKICEFREIVSRMGQYDLTLFACLSDCSIPLRSALTDFKAGKILVLIGPEGDFTPEEIRISDRDNCKFVSLGARVLKSDTAGLFVLSVINYNFFQQVA
ncbi:MAG: RsmE family RNA methyltransferase [Candidatus Omnitrophota bacterium]